VAAVIVFAASDMDGADGDLLARSSAAVHATTGILIISSRVALVHLLLLSSRACVYSP